ncbi:hypothetical protein CEUSTIGMA_g6735.t1 [Chlamydomonas eustigma]|uniref:RING-type domain-containing protein n=1 Tax=Chlamydomonas eustigma TaxID=1157962 RepID=A0A250X886_9CHLO|nr:hypothetical protein CEUSTIGMA_g6735.t1 [Chlamydomonas eustigma]|eukprot:GAX79294.1 hypothetical protein CEUSTIGMA_g6735.t1 [Chlamydomonas eustigma]
MPPKHAAAGSNLHYQGKNLKPPSCKMRQDLNSAALTVSHEERGRGVHRRACLKGPAAGGLQISNTCDCNTSADAHGHSGDDGGKCKRLPQPLPSGTRNSLLFSASCSRDSDTERPVSPHVADRHAQACRLSVVEGVQAAHQLQQVQRRPYQPLALALSCALCGDLLKEATFCTECLSTFCYDCVSKDLQLGGHHNVCPMPKCGSVLGPEPFQHGKLRHDFILDSIVAKVFPRPAIDHALVKRREERMKSAMNDTGSAASV